MSMPKFSDTTGITRENAINQVISAIAMEKLALSHILNAEGEKIQYILGSLDGSVPSIEPTFQQILEINESVQNTLELSLQKQILLKSQISETLSAGVLYGPTGPPGEAGPQGIAGPPGPAGEAGIGAILNFYSPLQGLSGPTGAVINPGDYGNIAIANFESVSSNVTSINYGDDIIFNQNDTFLANLISSSNVIMPRSGTITDFNAQLYAHSGMSGQPYADMTIVSAIYISNDGGLTYKLAVDTPIDFSPDIDSQTAVLTLFQTANISLNIPINTGDRIMFVLAIRVNSSTGNGSIITQNANFNIAIS